ncbi:hypothetical protein Ancab_029311 [Ancistrocladus abbreviatus]
MPCSKNWLADWSPISRNSKPRATASKASERMAISDQKHHEESEEGEEYTEMEDDSDFEEETEDYNSDDSEDGSSFYVLKQSQINLSKLLIKGKIKP